MDFGRLAESVTAVAMPMPKIDFGPVLDAMSALVADSVMPKVDFGRLAESVTAVAMPMPKIDFGPVLDAMSALVADSVMPKVDFGLLGESVTAVAMPMPMPKVDFGPVLDAMSALVADSRTLTAELAGAEGTPSLTPSLIPAAQIYPPIAADPTDYWDSINLDPLDATGHVRSSLCWAMSLVAGGSAWLLNAWLDGNTSPTDPIMIVLTVYLALRQLGGKR